MQSTWISCTWYKINKINVTYAFIMHGLDLYLYRFCSLCLISWLYSRANWLDNVQCQGHESSLSSCSRNNIGVITSECDHYDDVGVGKCT